MAATAISAGGRCRSAFSCEIDGESEAHWEGPTDHLHMSRQRTLRLARAIKVAED